ncbi:MAG: hypothetical protein M3151_07360, partial [Actinomycetota bacterium]|nr:hypothetical protein [Actinomycetota bacterium]
LDKDHSFAVCGWDLLDTIICSLLSRVPRLPPSYGGPAFLMPLVALVKERVVWTPQFNRGVVYHVPAGKITQTWSHDYERYDLDDCWS